MKAACDILIVGAGGAGLTSAAYLARQGLEVLFSPQTDRERGRAVRYLPDDRAADKKQRRRRHRLGVHNTVLPVENDMRKITRSINTPIPDVYQAGHWTFSPSGLPIAVLTGKLAADAVHKELIKR